MSLVAGWLAILADLATVAGIAFAVWTLRQGHVTQQVQLLDSVFQKIHGMEAEFYRAKREGADAAAIQQWRSLFMNALEYFAFLVNNSYMSARFASFLTPAFQHWHSTIVEPMATPAEKNDLEGFKEIRRLRRRIQEGEFRKYTG